MSFVVASFVIRVLLQAFQPALISRDEVVEDAAVELLDSVVSATITETGKRRKPRKEKAEVGVEG